MNSNNKPPEGIRCCLPGLLKGGMQKDRGYPTPTPGNARSLLNHDDPTLARVRNFWFLIFWFPEFSGPEYF